MDHETLTQALCSLLFVEVEASGRHVHLTEAQALTLFGHGLTPDKPLSQPGQYAAKERVTLRGPKGEFQNVAVLGPCRSSAQVEISLTDGRVLGLTPPVRLSGDTAGTPGCELLGPRGRITLDRGVVAAQRHIHLSTQDAARRGLKDRQVVRLKLFTPRPLVFENVTVRVSPDFAPAAHIDYDEANACAFSKGAFGMIVHG